MFSLDVIRHRQVDVPSDKHYPCEHFCIIDSICDIFAPNELVGDLTCFFLTVLILKIVLDLALKRPVKPTSALISHQQCQSRGFARCEHFHSIRRSLG